MDMISSVLSDITEYASLRGLLFWLAGVITSAIAAVLFFRFSFRKAIKQYKNISRKIYLLRTEGGENLESEGKFIRENGLFKIHETLLLSESIIHQIENDSLVVVGYSKSHKSYQSLIDRASKDKIPIIVIASPMEITPTHLKQFRSYPYFEMCNTLARLLTTILNMALVAPGSKR